MTELDPRGLEAAKAAYNHAGRHWQAVPKAIAAYLEATRPEGEPGKIAVVLGPISACAVVLTTGIARLDAADVPWSELEGGVVGGGPFARAIVECHLPRPAEPVTVQGRVR